MPTKKTTQSRKASQCASVLLSSSPQKRSFEELSVILIVAPLFELNPVTFWPTFKTPTFFSMLHLCIAALVLLMTSATTAAPSQHKVNHLPGLVGAPNFDTYAGYVTVDEARGSEYFYMFFTSTHDPSSDPLTVWFQGGPGCSGLFGSFLEIGPFVPGKDNGTIELMDVSWNALSNVLIVGAWRCCCSCSVSLSLVVYMACALPFVYQNPPLAPAFHEATTPKVRAA